VQEPSLARPFRIPLQSLFANFLFCVPTFALTVFILCTAEPTQLYTVLVLLAFGVSVWSAPSQCYLFKHAAISCFVFCFSYDVFYFDAM
jgi:hypothetical protein